MVGVGGVRVGVVGVRRGEWVCVGCAVWGAQRVAARLINHQRCAYKASPNRELGSRMFLLRLGLLLRGLGVRLGGEQGGYTDR